MDSDIEKYIGPIALLGVFILVVIAYSIAKRKELVCPNCHSKNKAKTGNRKDIDRSKWLIKYPIPDFNIEYECLDCGSKYWSTIERIYP